MKGVRNIIILSVIFLFAGSSYAWEFISGSTGADGAFNPTSNVELQVPPDGVFNFTTVNIPAGVIVTFKKHASNTPVYILATGDVTIGGVIEVNGKDGLQSVPGEGGPCGFRGGSGAPVGFIAGRGLGIGGGGGGRFSCRVSGTSYCWYGGGGGGFNSLGKTAQDGGGVGGTTYGNVQIIPLIGGSGGGGSSCETSMGGGGGGGGGAILIASSGTIHITGAIRANGGNGWGSFQVGGSGGGSGGALRLIANAIKGDGAIVALGGNGGLGGNGINGGSGGNGRIRLETYYLERTTTTSPTFTFGYPSTVFVAKIPELKIISIAGVNVPENAQGLYGTPDVVLPATITNPVEVTISGTNIPVGTTVKVTVAPAFGPGSSGADPSIATATLSGTNESSTATVSVNILKNYQSALTAEATFTIQVAMYYEGERIEKVRVATTMGKGQEVVYITESGKEVSAEKLLASLK
ncbi:MAG: hypothetical protein HY805_01145 [Nitrospirae bacterium]|nr:hypothetical protein [Nitrospirota bacterium]